MSNREIEQLIEQLQQLQIRQQEITRRLALITTNNRNTREIGETSNTIRATPETTNSALKIGDRVKIRNPKPNQAKSGVIAKIGKTNITVTSSSGEKIVCAPKNILKL